MQRTPDVLEGASLRYAPENEIGVVFLFADLAKRWRLKVDKIRPQYPDCIAYKKIGGKEERIRIEFEYRSRSFNHDPKKCDWLVCWEHNWPKVPRKLRVVELRREFGLGFNVWIQPVGNKYKGELTKAKRRTWWSVPWNSHKGDLVLFYRNHPEKCIEDIFVILSEEKYRYEPDRGGRRKVDFSSELRRVCCLKSPIFLEDLRTDRILKTAGFVRADMRGRPKVTEYWPYLYRMILSRNPSLRHELAKYNPARF